MGIMLAVIPESECVLPPHTQLVGGAVVERVVRVLDADAKAKAVIDVPKSLAEHEQHSAEKAQALEQRLERNEKHRRKADKRRMNKEISRQHKVPA
jgi:hypothetical protein